MTRKRLRDASEPFTPEERERWATYYRLRLDPHATNSPRDRDDAVTALRFNATCVALEDVVRLVALDAERFQQQRDQLADQVSDSIVGEHVVDSKAFAAWMAPRWGDVFGEKTPRLQLALEVAFCAGVLHARRAS